MRNHEEIDSHEETLEGAQKECKKYKVEAVKWETKARFERTYEGKEWEQDEEA